ncbi:juvenile hormone esterase-like [Arctopsyche grandis]|uniref:juvenile hormone esterase-like n=1 Tax=Arctopsyche grandis TaxID=121162 RepID=UPI00406DA2B2
MPELRLKVEQGELEGCVEVTEDGFEFNCYHHIPFAKPPLGDLRFRDPQPPEDWVGVRDAKVEGPANAQMDTMLTQDFTGSEDSLHLSVYVPSSANENSKLVVMVFIHGGAFRMGSNSKMIYGADRLVKKDVILVTTNYRLGALGFLCMNNEDVPGNAGLKDQVFALRWVQRNIAKFGGDSENVTIFGESAGAASVQYLMMSPMAKGLFARAILQSGSCLSGWARQKNPTRNVLEFSRDLGFKPNNLKDAIQYLRNVSVKDLIAATHIPFDVSLNFSFLPIVEKRINGVEGFLNSDPIELMKSGDFNTVPCINGLNSQEGVVFMMKNIIKTTDFSKVKDLSEVRVDLKTMVKEMVTTRDENKLTELVRNIKQFYLPRGKPFMEGCINLLSDIHFIKDIDYSINLMKDHSVVYMYNFSYNGIANAFRSLTNYPYTEAAHADELTYIFQPNLTIPGMPALEMSAEDKIVSDRLTTMWTNFAKFENPTPALSNVITELWRPVSMDEFNCLNISNDLKMCKEPYAERTKFWHDLLRANDNPSSKDSFNSKLSFWNKVHKP